MLKQKKLLSLVMLTGLLVCSTGCGQSKVILHPRVDKDFYKSVDGDYCFSQRYFNETIGTQLEVQDNW